MPPAFDFVDDLSRARNVRLEPNVTPHLEVCTTPLLCLVVRHRGTQPTWRHRIRTCRTDRSTKGV